MPTKPATLEDLLSFIANRSQAGVCRSFFTEDEEELAQELLEHGSLIVSPVVFLMVEQEDVPNSTWPRLQAGVSHFCDGEYGSGFTLGKSVLTTAEAVPHVTTCSVHIPFQQVRADKILPLPVNEINTRSREIRENLTGFTRMYPEISSCILKTHGLDHELGTVLPAMCVRMPLTSLGAPVTTEAVFSYELGGTFYESDRMINLKGNRLFRDIRDCVRALAAQAAP